MRLRKAYHPGMPKPSRIRTQCLVLLVTSIALVLAPTTVGAWLSEHMAGVAWSSPAGERQDGVQDRSAQAASAPESEPEQASSGSQPALKAQVEKLLRLATELKSDVDKTNKDMLSLSVVRKADEIEKLAHDMREEKLKRSSERH